VETGAKKGSLSASHSQAWTVDICQRTLHTSLSVEMVISDADVLTVRDVVGPEASDALIRGARLPLPATSITLTTVS